MLTPEILIAAYCQGIFPMASDRAGEIDWFEPQKRGVLDFDNLRISRSLAKVVESGQYTITIDRDFPAVINFCATLRDETWISHEIERAYNRLHLLGLAHSVEAWEGDYLAGGLYGVALGGAFFGESMFHRRRDASKAALVYLVRHLKSCGFLLLDTQYLTPHLESLGAVEIPREDYLRRLHQALALPDLFSVC